MTPMSKCPDCDGCGISDEYCVNCGEVEDCCECAEFEPEECSTCGGTGEIEDAHE